MSWEQEKGNLVAHAGTPAALDLPAQETALDISRDLRYSLIEGGRDMKHVHKYEPVLHQRVAPDLAKSGIEAAELRKCRECGKEMPFLLTKKGVWVQLFEEKEPEEQDILLA